MSAMWYTAPLFVPGVIGGALVSLKLVEIAFDIISKAANNRSLPSELRRNLGYLNNYLDKILVGKGEGSRVGKIPWNLQTVMLVSMLIVLVIIAIQLDTLIALKTAEVQQTGGDVTVTGEEQKKGKKPASKTS